MKRIKPLYIWISVLCTALLLWQGATAAWLTPSDWAKEEFEAAQKEGIIPLSLLVNDYAEDITRQQFCQLIMKAFRAQTGLNNPSPQEEHPFTDTDDSDVSAAYAIGLINGVGENLFAPDRPITRQETAKVLAGIWEHIKEDKQPVRKDAIFTDQEEIADWAIESVRTMVIYGFLNGDEQGNFRPNGNTTIEQAIILIGRMTDLEAKDLPVITSVKDGDIISSEQDLSITWDSAKEGEYTVYLCDGESETAVMQTGMKSATVAASLLNRNHLYYLVIGRGEVFSAPVALFTDRKTLGLTRTADEDYLYFSWAPVGGVKQYTVTVNQHRTNKSSGVIPPKETTYRVKTPNLAIPKQFHNEYTVTVSASANLKESMTFKIGDSGKYDNASMVLREAPEGGSMMADISVPVWRLKNGKKVAGTVSLTVNAGIADVTKQVFQEIFDCPEQFPVSSLGGFSIRGSSTSEHNIGTAIDLNADENYCLYGNGTVVGTEWKPGENPYSIDPYGNVIRIFEKYGFTWGGDAWSSNKDYMHFSFLGT